MKRMLHLVFVLVTLFAGMIYSQTTPYFLGTGFPEDQQGTSCASCHKTGNIGSPIYDKWKNTLHAVALDSLAGILSYNCISCHTTGWIPGTNNGGADEYVLKDTTVTPNYVITNLARWNRTKNVGCESCHGPLGAKNVVPGAPDSLWIGPQHTFTQTNINNIDYTAENCGKCHDGFHHPYFTEWEQSGHALSTQSAFVVNNKRCVKCHVAQNFIRWAKNPGAYVDTILVSAAQRQPITCVTCHDPHDRQNVGQLRFPITPQSTICDKCHTSEIDSVDVNTTPHHTTSEVLSGSPLFGFRYPGENYINSGHSFAATLRCVNCHVYPTPFNGTIAVTGHTFEPRTEACVSCHPDFYTAVDTSNHEKRFDYRNIQSTTDSLMNLLKTRLSTSTHEDSLTIEFKQANYNWNSIDQEGSRGIHNTRLVHKLLRDALSRYKPTAVQYEGGELPNSYELSQNYPNPFNPATTIKFSIPEAADVKVIVYDALGKEVEILAKNYYQPGNYKIEWNASQYASGIYFYRLESKNFNMVKKMVLIK